MTQRDTQAAKQDFAAFYISLQQVYNFLETQCDVPYTVSIMNTSPSLFVIFRKFGLLLVLLITSTTAFALTPTLSVTPINNGTQATVSVTQADPNSTVTFNYTSGFTNAIQTQNLGITDANGSFTTTVGQDTYNVSLANQVYVMVGGSASANVTWPLTTTANISVISFSTSSPFLNQGQSSSVTVSGDMAPYSIKSTTNPTGVISSLSGTTLSLYGNTAGTTTVTVCSNRNICGDFTISVILSTSSGVTPIALTIPVKVGQTIVFPLSGGNGQYYLTAPVSLPFKATISGSYLTVTGVTQGTNIATVCTSVTVCQVFMFTVSGQAEQTFTQQATSQPVQTIASTQGSPVAQVSASGRYVFTRGLVPGMKGTEVLELQKRLQLEGYLTSTPNGYYGTGTTKAVKTYQADNNLTPLGTVGPGTRALLNQE